MTERIAVGTVALALLVAHVAAGQVGIDIVDEGYFLSLADRVHQGGLPYRDFDTYYTPGIFYLYAGLFELFGVSVATVRVMIAVLWAGYWLLLYGLARRVVSPAFAVLPFLVVAVAEPSPLWPAAHPGWLALLAALLTVETVVRHQQRGRAFWLVAAGAAAAVAFLFKQNVGAFAALGVAGYIALRPRAAAGGWLLTGVRVAFVCAVALAATLLLRPALDGTLAAMLLLPLLATLLLLLLAARPEADAADVAACGHWLRQMGAESALAGGAFVLVTLLWLVPLMLALGPEHTPLGLFLGAVNQGALVVQLELPPRGARVASLVAIWLPLVLAMLSQPPSQRAWRPGLAACVPVSALILWMPMQRPQPAIGPLANPWPALLEAELGWLYVYLPAICAWAALVALVWTRGRRALVSGPFPWYLLFGTLVALSMYPRIDPLHAMMAGPPLFVVGAWALARAHGVLTDGASRVRKALVFLALLSLPIAAATPLVYWRFASLVLDNPLEPEPARYVPLGLERAPVLVLQRTATEIGGAVKYVREQTQPGVPVLAYPMLPMVNFLADRPNPTRFSHFLPGALTPEDVAGVIESLEAHPPPFVVWDHAGVLIWQTDTNRALTDYIWRCYEPVESFGLVLVLQRRTC